MTEEDIYTGYNWLLNDKLISQVLSRETQTKPIEGHDRALAEKQTNSYDYVY